MSLRNHAVLLAALLAALPSSAPAARGAEDDPATATITLKRGDKTIFLGDSLTALAIKDRNVPDGKGYVPLVREALKDRGVEVDAVATGGHRVPNLLARVDKDVLSKKPTVVVIQIGVNDAGSGVTPEKFKAQLEELIDMLQKAGAGWGLCSCARRVGGYT